jgi:hypothetical protein
VLCVKLEIYFAVLEARESCAEVGAVFGEQKEFLTVLHFVEFKTLGPGTLVA